MCEGIFQPLHFFTTMLLDDNLLDGVTAKAKESERLRMNYNLHESLDAKAQRLFNALEPGTLLPIHRHKDTAETYLVVRGSLDVIYYNEKGEDALAEDIMKSIREEKSAGRLTNEMIVNMASLVARFASPEQRKKLEVLVQQILDE